MHEYIFSSPTQLRTYPPSKLFFKFLYCFFKKFIAPIVSGIKINFIVLLFFLFKKKSIKHIDNIGPESSLLAIDG